MQEFEDGSEVVVVSLGQTGIICGLSRLVSMAVGNELTVSQYDEGDDTYKLSDGGWYSAVDLNAVVVEVPDSGLELGDVEVGDDVRILRIERSTDEFGNSDDYEVGDTVRIQDTDEDDDSIYTGFDWIFLADVELVDSEEIDASDEEWDVPADDERSSPVCDPVPEPEVNYLITRDSVTLSIDGNSEVATADHQNFMAIRANVLAGDHEAAMALMNVSIGIQNWGQGALSIEDGKIFFAQMELTGKLVDRIIDQMVNGDIAFERFAKFLNLTMAQESYKTRARLMDFAAHDKLDINEDGYVVAFKNVRENYMDKHSGTFDNHVGESPSLPRHMVNDDHETTCAAGLHVCSPEYLKEFWGTSGKTMRVVVDPRDFVAIPYDYNDSKARVCKYTVVEDVTDNINEYL